MREGAVAVVFDDQKDNVLFVKRRDVPIWVLPGGGIDPGESPDVAAVREVFEESGLEVRVVRKVAVYTPTGKLTSETHLFECCVVGGQTCTSNETKDVGFFPVDSYPPPVFEVHNGWLKDTCENRPEIIMKPVEGLDWACLLKIVMRHPVLATRYLLTKIGLRWNSR
ncbi:MAG: NUDIX domain-containing protein [Fuerstiella sp.]|jgi:8-oxo-dGTP diphosphatase|nr:NUDIX domain-containing protein [Fuerstiella sp.]MCP4505154.1 NUDIX domain-containing protein [Fuerstiella sp.]MDG2130996.1 NUDIX domain-containing protein [Fuerstiella sp.]